MNNLTQTVAGLFWLAVGVGALVMVVRNPEKANALLAAGPDTITSITHGLESGKVQ